MAQLFMMKAYFQVIISGILTELFRKGGNQGVADSAPNVEKNNKVKADILTRKKKDAK